MAKINKGQFQKGHKKLGGRKKGTPNKITIGLKDKINDFIHSSYEDVIESFKCLEPRDKVNTWIKILPYVLAKQQEIHSDIGIQIQASPYDLTKLSDVELDQLQNLMRKLEAPVKLEFESTGVEPIRNEMDILQEE